MNTDERNADREIYELDSNPGRSADTSAAEDRYSNAV